MTVSVLPGTPGHSTTQQRSDCTDCPSVPVTVSAGTRPVRSVLSFPPISLSSAVSEGTAHSPDVPAGCCLLLEKGCVWLLLARQEPHGRALSTLGYEGGGISVIWGICWEMSLAQKRYVFSVSVLPQVRGLLQFMCQKYLL